MISLLRLHYRVSGKSNSLRKKQVPLAAIWCCQHAKLPSADLILNKALSVRFVHFRGYRNASGTSMHSSPSQTESQKGLHTIIEGTIAA